MFLASRPGCRLWKSVVDGNDRLLVAFPSRWGCRTASFGRLDEENSSVSAKEHLLICISLRKFLVLSLCALF